MATLVELCDTNQLFLLNPHLGCAKVEERFIFLTPRAKNWFEDELPTMGSTWNIEVNPQEQVDALMEIFCSGEPLIIGRMFKALTHLGDGIWQLKTADIRMFGWFLKKDHFIISASNSAEQVKQLNQYRPYCEQAERDRNLLDLNAPKFIAGVNPDDVVSNWLTP